MDGWNTIYPSGMVNFQGWTLKLAGGSIETWDAQFVNPELLFWVNGCLQSWCLGNHYLYTYECILLMVGQRIQSCYPPGMSTKTSKNTPNLKPIGSPENDNVSVFPRLEPPLFEGLIFRWCHVKLKARVIRINYQQLNCGYGDWTGA